MADASSKQSVPGFHVVIPARYESTRLPGKPLVDIAGQPMIVRVARAAAASGALNVIVATDDERVANAVIEAGFDAQMTRTCLLYTSPSPRDQRGSRMPSSA